MLPNRGAFPCFTRTFVNARLAEVRRSLLLCPGCVERFEVDVCSVNRYPCAEDACYRTSVSSLVQGVGTTSSAPQAAACLSRSEIRSTKGALLAGAAAVQPVMPVRLSPRPARRALAISAAIGRFDHTGAAEPGTAAAPAAPDGADPVEPRTGQKRKASSAPDVCLELLARARYCALHACADAHGRATDCTAGPPAAAAAASVASAAPIEFLHVGRAAACLAGPAAVCLPAAAPARRDAHAHARPAFDAATAAVRRCRIG